MDKMNIALAGSLGMILDNILGSLWQSKYKETDDITEEKTADYQTIGFFGVNSLLQ